MSDSIDGEWIDVVSAEDGKVRVIFHAANEYFAFDLTRAIAAQLHVEIAHWLSTA
jgi:hypothetical protein